MCWWRKKSKMVLLSESQQKSNHFLVSFSEFFPQEVLDFLLPCGPSGFQSSSRQHTDHFQRLRLLTDGRHLDVPVRLLQEWTHFVTLTWRFGTFLLTSICDTRQNLLEQKPNLDFTFLFLEYLKIGKFKKQNSVRGQNLKKTQQRGKTKRENCFFLKCC